MDGWMKGQERERERRGGGGRLGLGEHLCLGHTLSQLEVRSKLAEKKTAGEGKPERKRRRWDQQTSEEDGPTKKKSAWDQAEVRERVVGYIQ